MRYLMKLKNFTESKIYLKTYENKNNFQKDDIIICIDNLNGVGLTKGKAYKVIENFNGDRNHIKVNNDFNEIKFYYSSRFISELDFNVSKYNL